MTHQHGGTDAPECRSCKSQRLPTEKQLESTFEVLAWLKGRLVARGYAADARLVDQYGDILKGEVDRCLDE